MIDIITVHQNIYFLIKNFLSTLKENTDIPYRLIVVDNCTNNKSKDFLREQKDITLIELTLDSYEDILRCLPILEVPSGCQVKTEGRIISHGQCLDVVIPYVKSDFFVTIDTDVLVKKNWLGRLLKEMDNKSVSCVGQSKYGPYDLSRIWVATCMYRTEYFMKNRTTMQPIKYGTKTYDTGDYQSVKLWLKYQNKHIEDFPNFWNHICGFHWFYNCLRTEPEYKYYRMFDDNGKFCVGLDNRPLHTIINTSWWYQKLYSESQPNDMDIPWTLEHHNQLIRTLKEQGYEVNS